MSNQWREAKLFKFLRLYKRYECLWNPYSPEYENYNAKSEAFSQILCAMNVVGLTVNECSNQIRHIRETYKKEQQRLESLAFLGGRSYSNLLWYPLMNSMLSKIIQDEEKLNQVTDNLNLVIVPKRLPFNSGDHRSRRHLNRIRYRRRIISWDYNKTTKICPYLPNSNFGNNMNCYPDPNIPNNSIGMYIPNEHISSCPTCGYSSSSSCNCFFTNNVGYHGDNIGHHSSQTQINYRPRTSYNYSNGILEINSAVRIPVSQPSPNYGYHNPIESTMPEEPEYNLNTAISSNHQSDVPTIIEEDEFSMKCYATSSVRNNQKFRRSNEYEFQEMLDHAADNNSNPSNLLINKNDESVKNINWGSKKSKRTKGNVNEIVRFQKLLGVTGVAQNSICKTIKYEKSVADNSKSLQVSDHKNLNKDIQHSPRIESKKLFNIEQEMLMLNPKQQSIVNIKTEKVSESDINMTKTNVKVQKTLTVASKNGQPIKKNITSKILEAKPQWNKDLIQSNNFQTNCKLNSPESPNKKTRSISNQQRVPGVINDWNEKISNAETARDTVEISKSIIKHNLTKMVIDFIDEALNKPDEISKVDAEERLILKKVAKDLQALRKESNCTCNDKLAMEDYQQSQQSCKKNNFCNKTICWREPIEESLNTVPCKSIRSPENTSNYKENVLTRRSIQLNKGTENCFRMMAGADFDIDNDTEQCDLSHENGIRSKSKIITTMGELIFNENLETRYENIILPNCKEHLMIAMDKYKERNNETNSNDATDKFKNEASQTNPEECVLDEVKSVQLVNVNEVNHTNSKVARHENLKLLAPNYIENKECPVIIDKLCLTEESVDLESRNIDVDGKIIQKETNLNSQSCENHIDNSEYCNPRLTLQDIMEVEDGVTIHISVETSAGKENEIIDKVVNKITCILRKTLDKNVYAIEKKQFFRKKNLITNDNGEINQKLIGNEAVWKTELRNIIGHLIKHKKVGDSIRFKVKTMILPVTSKSHITEREVANLTSSPQRGQNLSRSKQGLNKIPENCANSTRNKADQYEISRNMHKSLFKDERKIFDESKNEYTRIAKNSKSEPKVNHLAQTNDSNDNTEVEANYEISARKLPDKTQSRTCTEQFRDFDSDIMFYTSSRDLQFKKQLLKNEIKKSSKRNRHIISKCALKNVTQLDKMLFNHTNGIVLPSKDFPHTLWKLLKHFIKFRNKSQSISKKYEKSSRNESQGNNYKIINDRKFKQSHHQNDSVAAIFRNKLPHNLHKDIDVYLCTEISQEDNSPMLENAGYDNYSDNSILLNDVNKNSPSTRITIQASDQIENTTNSHLQKNESKTDQDDSEWESFSDSDDEVKIVKQIRHQNKIRHQISKKQSERIISAERYALTVNLNQSHRSNDDLLVDTSCEQNYPAVYALTKTTKNTFRYQKQVNEVKLLDTVIQSNNKDHPMHSQTNGSNNISSLQNNCKIIDIFSNNQNISPKELQSSEGGSKASSCCPEFEEAREAMKHQIPNRSESEEAQSLLEAKLRIAADNHIKPCCTEDQTHRVCTPICDVTSRLRLCAIIKSPNETSSANHNTLSNNICCCDDVNKLKNDNGAHFKPHIKPSQKDGMIKDASVRLPTASCQTEPFERDLKLLEPQSHASSKDCRENTTSGFEVSHNEIYTKNSAAIDSRIIVTKKDIKPPDNVDHSKSTTIKELATIQSNTQNSTLTSLEIPAFAGGSLILEIKMLQPLFSIELKKSDKNPEKTRAQVKQNSCELSEQKNHDADTCLDQESVIKSIPKNGGMSSQQQSMNCANKSTSTNSINDGVQKMMDQGTELLMGKNEKEALSCGAQVSQTCKESDLNKQLKFCLDDSTSSTSIAFNELKKNASTSFQGKWDCSDSSQCNLLIKTLRLLKNYLNPCEINSNEFLINNSVTCADKAMSQPKENSSDEMKSITVKTLINIVETSLQHIADPIIHQKLVDTIKYVRDQDQNQNYSSKQNPLQDQACETLKRTLKKNGMEMQIKSEDNIRPESLLSITKDSECQKPSKSHAVVDNSCRNIKGVVADVKTSQDQNEDIPDERVVFELQTKMASPTGHTLTKKKLADQISKNESQVMLPIAEKSYCRSKPHLILTEHKTSLSNEVCANEIGAREKARSKSPFSRFDSGTQILKVEDPNNTLYEILTVSKDEPHELLGNSCLMDTSSYSSNEITPAVEEVESDSSSSNPSIDERLNMTPQLQNDENYGSLKHYCCHIEESTKLNINAFASMVASQLRGLSTEAALRSQQRIQTLISNSRLESEKNKRHQ